MDDARATVRWRSVLRRAVARRVPRAAKAQACATNGGNESCTRRRAEPNRAGQPRRCAQHSTAGRTGCSSALWTAVAGRMRMVVVVMPSAHFTPAYERAHHQPSGGQWRAEDRRGSRRMTRARHAVRAALASAPARSSRSSAHARVHRARSRMHEGRGSVRARRGQAGVARCAAFSALSR